MYGVIKKGAEYDVYSALLCLFASQVDVIDNLYSVYWPRPNVDGGSVVVGS